MTANLTRISFIFLVIAMLLASCDSQEKRAREESSKLLALASEQMEKNPQESQSLLKQINTELLTDDEFAYYVLLQARVAGICGLNIAWLDDAVSESVAYFSDRGDAANATFAYFVLAKVYEAQKNLEMMLFCYRQADEWAGMASYQIPNFTYSTIPYNTAIWYYRDGHYETSLQLIEKALEYINIEKGNLRDKLYALELKALNFKHLDKPEEAFAIYDEVLTMAQKQGDTININRIRYNQYVLLCRSDNYDLTEEKCRELLPTIAGSKDSIHIGLLTLAMARIYASTNRADSAIVNVFKAEGLLQKGDKKMKEALDECFLQIEQRYDKYKAILENKRKSKQAALKAEGEFLQKEEADRWLSKSLESKAELRQQRQSEATTRWLVNIIIAYNGLALISLAVWFYLFSWRKRARRRAA